MGRKHSRFTRVWKAVTKPVKENPGIAKVVGIVIGSLVPGGGAVTAAIGGAIGSAADAAAQNSQARNDRRAAEYKVEEEQQRVQSQINAAQQQDLNQAAEARAALDAQQQQANAAGQNLHAEARSQADALNLQHQLANQILDCCDTNRRQLEGGVNRRLDGVPALLNQLSEVGRELLGNRAFACAHIDDRVRILAMMERAQQRAEEPRPAPAPDPARAVV